MFIYKITIFLKKDFKKKIIHVEKNIFQERQYCINSFLHIILGTNNIYITYTII